MSGCYFAVICNNKLLNFVLFHKCSFSLIILKFSVKPYHKIPEKLGVEEVYPIQLNVTVKCPNFKIQNLV